MIWSSRWWREWWESDPRQNKLLAVGNKADRIDAIKLAHLLRAGLLKAVYHGKSGTRTLKELTHCYDSLLSALDASDESDQGGLSVAGDRMCGAGGVLRAAAATVARQAWGSGSANTSRESVPGA